LLVLLLFYLVMPVVGAWLVLKFIRRFAPPSVSPEMAALYAASPIERKWFRALRRDAKGLRVLGDFEKQPEAVECIYRHLEEAKNARETAAFLVANDEGELLEEVDSEPEA
jgi:hypothetical protein